MDEITILGRGKSLEKLEGFKTDSNKVILVNEFWETHNNSDYHKEPLIAGFIKGKDITLITSPAVGSGLSLTNELESAHNVVNKFNTVWASGSGTGRDLSPAQGWAVMPEECLEDFRYTHLSGNIKSDDCVGAGVVRGSLAYAILVAVRYYNASKVNIFGLDFYEQDYYIPPDYNYETEKTQCDSIKKDFSSLLNYYKDIQFNVYTLANYNPNLDNINVL